MEDLRYESEMQYLSFQNDQSTINETLSTEANVFVGNYSEVYTNDTVIGTPISQIPTQEWYIVIYTIFIAASILLTPLSRNVCYVIFMRASKTLHNKMFNNILQAPMRFFDTNPSGKYSNNENAYTSLF